MKRATHEVSVARIVLQISGRPDLNRGPHRPERCALPGCATPRERRLSQSGAWGAARRGRAAATLDAEAVPSDGDGAQADPDPRACSLLAAVPAAAQAYLPPGFIGVSPQNAGTAKDFELMREAGVDSVRLPLYWSAVEPENPAFAERRLGRLRPRGRLAAEAGIADLAVRHQLAGMGGAARRSTCRSPAPGSAGLGLVPARGGATATGPTAPSGAKKTRNCRYLPIRRWEIWNEENIVTFAADPNRRASRR